MSGQEYFDVYVARQPGHPWPQAKKWPNGRGMVASHETREEAIATINAYNEPTLTKEIKVYQWQTSTVVKRFVANKDKTEMVEKTKR